MLMPGSKYVIIIPVHKENLTENETIALNQCLKLLGEFPVMVIKPESLNTARLQDKFPGLQFESFPDPYFDGIYGYNRLMLSRELYQRFLDFEYLLIYQLDCFVFRNELEAWGAKGYDYIGAPWVIKPKYRRGYYRVFWLVRSLVDAVLRRRQIIGKVGNGGFSLRKVRSFYDATLEKEAVIKKYLHRCRTKNLFNEDVFWGTENPGFNYPSYDEALQFAFDRHPVICYQQARGRLPFGCHGWSKASKISFWKPIISQFINRPPA